MLANLVSTDPGRWLPAIEDEQIRELGNYRGPVYGVNVPVPVTKVARLRRAGQLAARNRPPRPAVEDADGLDLRPDPQQARTAAELVAALQEFREWAGEPSYRTMAEQCGQMVSTSTLQRTLTRRALPRFEAVMAVIIGCGGDEDDKRRFASAWRTVRFANRRAATSSPPGTMLHAVREAG